MILEIMLILLGIEIILRFFDYKKEASPMDLSEYPYFRFCKKNTYGRHPYYLTTLGKNNLPKIRYYSEGIRGDIKNSKKDIILCLGDSYTEGGSLIEKETYPGILQKYVKNKYDIINAGISGYGLFQEYKLFNDLLKYKPKIILLQLLDLKRVPLDENKMKDVKKYFLFRQKLKKISILLWYITKLKKPKYNQIMDGYYYNRKTDRKNDFFWKHNIFYLNNINSICKSRGIKLIIFFWSSDPRPNPFIKSFNSYCDNKDIITFDSKKIFSFYPYESLTIKNDGHPSPIANNLIAKVSFNTLVKENLI